MTNSRKIDPRAKQLLEEALNLKNEERYEEAVRVLKKLVRQFPNSAPGHGLLGGYLFSFLNRPKQAIPHARKAVELAPRSKLASLCLFHSLWSLDRIDEAIAEMKRFLDIGYCDDYTVIIEEMYNKWVLGENPPVSKSRKTHRNSKAHSLKLLSQVEKSTK